MTFKTRLIFVILFFILMLVSASFMYILDLWSYLPLGFFLGYWGVIVFLFYNKLWRDNEGYSRFILSSLTGCLLAFSFPPSVFTPAIFIAFVPLLFSFFRNVNLYGKKAIKGFLWDSYHAFVIWNILSTFWVANSALAPAFVAIWVNSFLMLLPIIVTAYAYVNLDKRVVYASLIAPWILFEYAHMNWELSWPWLNLGNAFSGMHWIVQWYEYTGVLGGTLWALIVNVMISMRLANSSFLDEKITLKRIISKFKDVILIITLPVLLSLGMYFGFSDKNENEPVKIALIQPNFEPHYEKFRISEGAQVERILRLMDSVYTSDLDYIILPETVFGNIDLDAPFSSSGMRLISAWLSDHPGIHLITGVSSYRFVENETDYSRKVEGSDELYERQNAAIEIVDKNMLDAYFKSRFVPGAEIFPYKNILFFAEPIVDKLGGSVAGYVPQEFPSNFNSGKASIAPIICYESIYGEYVSGYVQKGAGILAILTNDGWWDDTPGHIQHLDFARLRAIEQHREIVRAANTGISAFYNAKGDIIKQTAYSETIAIVAEVQPNSSITFYTRWGNIIGRLALFVVIIIGMQLLVARFKKAKL